MILKKMYYKLQWILLLLSWLVSSGALLAQQNIVTGTVRDADGLALPGVSILVKNTSTGTNSDAQGRYSISAANDAVLVFSFIGFTSQEIVVDNQGTIDVILAGSVQELSEVVVTALGITRSTKALQSTITKIPGVSLTQFRENNLGSSIQGRVAGVNVTKASTGPAGSSRVIIRGNKNLGGENKPLYVVDGIPIDNTNMGRAGIWGGADWGDGLSSINPEDIESVSILKGAAASALYGSRGGFGVINIVTKRGSARKGIGIEFNSSYVFETVMNLSDLQTEYGSGSIANSDPKDPASPRVYSKPLTQQQAFNWGVGSSWGPKYDGSPVIQFDSIKRPYSYAGDNWKRFYQKGYAWTNSIALSGGSANQTFRFSFSDLKSTYIIPNSGFDRKNASLSANGKFGEKVNYDAKILYANEEMKNRTNISDSPGNPVQTIWSLPGNINVEDLYGDPDKPGAVAPGVTTPDNKSTGEEFQPADNDWMQNPWWCAYQYRTHDTRDRVIASANLRYSIFDWLYLQGRLGMDLIYKENSYLVPQGTGYQRLGKADEYSFRSREINMEWILGFDKKFGRIGINSFVGGNKMIWGKRAIEAYGENFNVPFFTSVINTKSQTFYYGYQKAGINSLYASTELNFDNYLFITATARNDWFSVLNPARNSKLYPSVGGSFLFTEAFAIQSDILSYGKLRVAWGQVATANIGPYQSNLTYSLMGQGHLGLPLGRYYTNYNLPNPNLSPALSAELEFGTDLKFFSGRLGLEFTYYDQKTTGDILKATISSTTGFGNTTINIGEMSNRGIELLINAMPVSGPVTWDISLNFAKNRNKVINLGNGITELIIEEPRTRTVYIKHIVGYPFGMITGYVQKRDDYGNKVYDVNGQPVISNGYEIIGNGVADFTGGLNNSLTWKGINLNFLIDFKFGGDIYSGTNVRLTQWGLTKQTLINREGDMVVEGVKQTGTGSDDKPIYETFSLALDQEQTMNYWRNLGECDQSRFIYDASFIKLRQVSLEYVLPASLLKKTPFNKVAVAIIGRNLAILYDNIDNVDPESNYSDSNAQGLDYFGMPGTRSYGFNLKVIF